MQIMKNARVLPSKERSEEVMDAIVNGHGCMMFINTGDDNFMQYICSISVFDVLSIIHSLYKDYPILRDLIDLAIKHGGM